MENSVQLSKPLSIRQSAWCFSQETVEMEFHSIEEIGAGNELFEFVAIVATPPDDEIMMELSTDEL